MRVLPDCFSLHVEESEGVALLRLAGRVRDTGNDFRLVNVPNRIRKIFELAETDDLVSEGAGS
jgi:hypothetical protein